jgi:ribosome-associated toxin RatA of RatAB toxin-antitoxin module
MGVSRAEHSLEIVGTMDECFDAIVDYETFPKWQSAVEKTEVLERDKKKLGTLVHLYVSTKGRKVDYTLRYSYDRPERIWWDFVEGNGVKDVDGEYTFEDLGGGRTLATYKLGVEIGLPIPGAIAKRIHKQALTRSVEDLKTEVERRNGGQSGASQPAEDWSQPEEDGILGAGGGGVLGMPVAVAKKAVDTGVKAAEAGVSVAGSVAGSVLGRVGGALERLRGNDKHDDRH